MNYYFKWRVIEPWCEPDGQNIHSPSKSLLSWKDMKDFTPGSKTVKFVEDCKKWGYNGMSFYMDPEENIEATSSFAKHLKDKGIGMIIRREWTELEGKKSWPCFESPIKPRVSRLLCPYAERAKAYWEQRIGEDYRQIPDLMGYRMNGTAYVFINGGPWMCDCEECSRRTERERTRDAIRLVSTILGKYGGVLFWETAQDDPNGQYEEAVYFDKMTGEIPENAVILIKDTYWDYHSGYPRHPLFDTIARDESGKSPYMTSIQLAGEYRGVHKFPWCMVDEWARLMPDMVRTGQIGLWVMAITEYKNWDHPLNMVNWYAISRFMKEPLADPYKIKLEWAESEFGTEFGKDAAPVVVKVIDIMTEAAKNMFEFKGLWTQQHSRYPTLEYLDTRLCGPCRESLRQKGMMGHTWPLHMYTTERVREIKACDRTRLIFTQEPITEELKAEMMGEKQKAIDLAREAAALWDTLDGQIDGRIEAAGSSRHGEILKLLKGNIDDAILWYMGFEMYMDMKLGKLTEERIDQVLSECREKGLKGTIVDNPLDPDPKATDCCHDPSSLKKFAEELRRELRSPWLEDAALKTGGEDTFSILANYEFVPGEE